MFKREIPSFLLSSAILLGMFFIFNAVPGMLGAAGSRNGVGLSYFAWVSLIGCLAHIPSDVETDIDKGVMQRLVLTGSPLAGIVLARAAVGLLRVPSTIALLLLALKLIGKPCPDPGLLIPVAVGAALFGSCLGIALAGLALLIRPTSLLQLPLYVVLMIGMTLAEPLVERWRLSLSAWLALLIPLCVGTGWAAVVVFRACERHARRNGLLEI